MAKLERTIERDDGSQVKIVAEEFFSPFTEKPSLNVFVQHRANKDEQWRTVSDQPHPNWRQMSVDQYVKEGRSEMLTLVTPGELLQVAHALNSRNPEIFGHPGDEAVDDLAPPSPPQRPRPGA